jgi:hypothetical protein
LNNTYDTESSNEILNEKQILVQDFLREKQNKNNKKYLLDNNIHKNEKNELNAIAIKIKDNFKNKRADFIKILSDEFQRSKIELDTFMPNENNMEKYVKLLDKQQMIVDEIVSEIKNIDIANENKEDIKNILTSLYQDCIFYDVYLKTDKKAMRIFNGIFSQLKK